MCVCVSWGKNVRQLLWLLLLILNAFTVDVIFDVAATVDAAAPVWRVIAMGKPTSFSK